MQPATQNELRATVSVAVATIRQELELLVAEAQAGDVHECIKRLEWIRRRAALTAGLVAKLEE